MLKISPCGFNCNECEEYLATQANDPEQLSEVAKKWSRYYGGGINPEKCVCDGCVGEGRLSTAHAATCELRKCAIERGFPTCAHCDDYKCALLEQFISFAPEICNKLAIIRDGLDE